MHRAKTSLQLLNKLSLSTRTSQIISQRNSANKYPKNVIDNSSNKRNYASTTNISKQQATAAAAKAEPFLNGTNSAYVEEMYESWLLDSSSVHKVHLKYFKK